MPTCTLSLRLSSPVSFKGPLDSGRFLALNYPPGEGTEDAPGESQASSYGAMLRVTRERGGQRGPLCR